MPERRDQVKTLLRAGLAYVANTTGSAELWVRRFWLLMLERVPAGPSAPIEVIVNWRERVTSRTSP